MKWTARVARVSGAVVHSLGARQMPPAASVEITQVPHGYEVVRLSSDGKFAGDTWHATLEDVNAQLEMELGIQQSDWVAAR